MAWTNSFFDHDEADIAKHTIGSAEAINTNDVMVLWYLNCLVIVKAIVALFVVDSLHGPIVINEAQVADPSIAAGSRDNF